MKRREFIRNAALAGMTAGVARTSKAMPFASTSRGNKNTSPLSRQDDSDRSPNRDPQKIHDSTLIVSGLDVATQSETYIQMMKKGGVNCWHKSMGGIESYAPVLNFCDAHSSDIAPATTVHEIEELHKQGKISLVFGSQSADFLGSSMLNPMYGPPQSILRAYYELGLRILGIAYNLANYFGAGNFEPQTGLSRAGKLLVEEMHKLGIILDVGGHTGEKTSLDALEISSGVPVICSHTNVAAIADNPRCTSDRLIEAIAKTGGVIGLTAVNDFHIRGKKDIHVAHSPRIGIKEHVDQYDYIKKLVGVDHIGIGPDFIHGRGINYDLVNQSMAINREIISDGEWLYLKSFENISELPNVTKGLIERGWSTGEIRKVLGENWLRVYKQVWGA
ncbi:dipeptidase [Acidobacteriota bacterium]